MIKNISIEVHHPHPCTTQPPYTSLQQLKETRKKLLTKYIQSQKHLLPQSSSTQHRLFLTAPDVQNVHNGLNTAITKGNVVRILENLQNGKNCQSFANLHDQINNLSLKNVQNLQKVQNLQNVQNLQIFKNSQIVSNIQNTQNLQSQRINHTNAQNSLNVKN